MTSKLPTIQELTSDKVAYEKADELNYLLNQPVPKKWIKHHPYIKIDSVDEKGNKIKKPLPYLPIDKVEYLLKKIFKRVRIEILREGTAFNGVYVSVRVHYFNPVFNEWDFHDGIGSIHLQVKSGSSPANLNDINNGALSMAFPLAKSLAVKDACDHIGEVFGANLARQDVISYPIPESMMNHDDLLTEIISIFNKHSNSMPVEEAMNIERIIDQKETQSYSKALKHLKKYE